jgi:hypothetical protein
MKEDAESRFGRFLRKRSNYALFGIFAFGVPVTLGSFLLLPHEWEPTFLFYLFLALLCLAGGWLFGWLTWSYDVGPNSVHERDPHDADQD